MKEASKFQIISYPPRYPKSVHLYITNECNLDCEKCFYRSKYDQKKQLSYKTIESLFLEWQYYGLTSIAIGGGEPLLHPDIAKIIQKGRELNFFVAVTTNGTILKSIKPHRIHISYDELHPTLKNEQLIQDAINFYKKFNCKVEINHIVTNLENIEYINSTFENFHNLLLIREKSKSSFIQWDSIPFRQNYWIDGCIEDSVCEQGILGFHLDYELNASICSNFGKKIRYSTLNNTWVKLKDFKCKLRDKPHN
ncbi:MAG: radical SAM protein [Candidatus Thorarchaeota archaeon]